jgi:hypothetical protein
MCKIAGGYKRNLGHWFSEVHVDKRRQQRDQNESKMGVTSASPSLPGYYPDYPGFSLPGYYPNENCPFG